MGFWDHKPPLIFGINAIGFALTSNSWWGVWMLELVSLFIAAMISYQLFQRKFDRLTAILTTAIWLLTLTYMLGRGNLTTEYALPLQFLCLLIADTAESTKKYRRNGLMIGMATGFLFLLKQNTVGIPIAILLYSAAAHLSSDRWRNFLIYSMSIGAGFLMICSIPVIYLAANNALADFWDQAFVYNFVYIARASLRDRAEALYRALLLLSKTNLALFGILGWSLTLISGISSKKFRSDLSNTILIIGLINLPIEILFASMGGRLINHHFITLLPVFSIFCSLTISQVLTGIQNWITQKSLLSPRWIIAGALVISLPLAYLKPLVDYTKRYSDLQKDQDLTSAVIKHIVETTSPEDSVLALEAETYVNFASKRVSPTRYTYQYPLTIPGYASEEMLIDFFQSISDKPPALIIDKRGRGLDPSKYSVQSERINQSISSVHSSYVEQESIGTWTIYAYR